MKQKLWKKATSLAMSVVLAAGLCPALALADEGDLQATGQVITALDDQGIESLEDGKYTVDVKNSISMTKFSGHDDPSLAPYVVVNGDSAHLVVFYQSSRSKSAWRYGQIAWGAYDEIDQSADGFVGIPIYKEGKSEADGNSDDTVYAMKFVMDIPTADLIGAVNDAKALPYTVKYVSDYKDQDLAGKWWKSTSPTTFTLSDLVKVSDSTHTTYQPYALIDGEVSLPDLQARPSTMLNHFDPDSGKLNVSGDTAVLSFTFDGSTASVAKYSRLALGNSDELIETNYQAELPEGTIIIDGVDAGQGEKGTKWAYRIELTKSQAASLFEGERLYITGYNSEKSGWYKASDPIYLTFNDEKVIANVKNDAIDELSKCADSNAYRAAEKAEVDAEVAAGNAAIVAATTEKEVNEALAAAEEKISQIKTDAQLAAEEKAAADAKAAEEAAAAEKAAAEKAAAEQAAAEKAAADAKAAEEAKAAAEAAAQTAGLEVGKTETAGTGASAATVTATSADAVTYAAPADKSAKSVTVPDTVTVNGKTYKVTTVAANAFKGSKAKSATIGKNVTSIGKQAFKGAKNLKKVTIKSKSLKSKKAIKNAFKGSKVKTVVLKGMTAKQKKAVKKAILKYGGKKVTVK